MAKGTKPGDSSTSKKPGTGQPSRPGGITANPAQPAAKPQQGSAGVVQPGRVYGPYQQETTRRGVTTGMGSRQTSTTQPSVVGTTPQQTTTPNRNVVVPAAPVAPTPVTPVDWEEAAKELYGGYYAIVQSVPELQDLLRKAVQLGWGDGKFEYELRQTNWWKQNSSSAREWDLQSQMDPATAQQEITNRVVEFQNIAASQFGVQLNQSQIEKLARDSLRFGWTQQMVTNAIGFEATKSTGGMGQLASGFIGQDVRQTANAYGLKLSDDIFTRWVSSIASGQETKDRFQQYALNSAKTLFPAIAPQLDTGLTFQQIVDPFRTAASQILEISPDSIDFTDPKWARAISTVEQNGQQRMMSFSEWGDYLRTERSFGYEYTSDAQQKAYKVANDLANLFGKA